MRRWSAFDALSLATLGLAAAITAGVYDRLPRRLAVHFDVHGVANGFMPKATGACLTLVVAAITFLVLRVGPAFFPGLTRKRMNESPVAVVTFLVVLSVVGTHLFVIHAGLARRGLVPGGVGALLGLGGLALALVMPRVRRNPVLGIRTPWTLASDENWARTHHFGGYA